MSRLKWVAGASLARRRTSAEKQVEASQGAMDNAAETTPTAEKAVLATQRLEAKQAFEQAEQAQADYHENLQGVAEEIHPFSLTDDGINRLNRLTRGLKTGRKPLSV